MNATIRRTPAPARCALIIAVAAALTGCVHNMSVSTPALPADYRNASAASAGASSAEWWEALGDPALTALIARGLRDNLDLASASARIAAARARAGVADSLDAPQITSSTRSSREKLSDNGLLRSSAAGGAFPDDYTLSSTGLDASWELDLFGAHAAERRKADARYRQSIAEREAVRLALTAEIARVYVEHIAYAQQLASARAAIELSEQRLTLIEQQYESGQAARAEVAAAQLSLQAIKEEAPQLQAELEARRYAMGVLLGSAEYAALPDRSALFGEDLSGARTQISVELGLPSDLLRRRPDIRRAESQFEAAVADRSIAVADQYPRFSIVASAGYESLERGSLLDAASQVWGVAPQVSLPLFDGGRRKAVVKEREAQVSAATAAYRQAVLQALSDVEQALIRHHGATSAMSARLEGLERSRELLTWEQARFEAGALAKPELLAAQRDYEDQRQAALDAKKQALLSLIALYKALGGEVGQVSS